MLRISKIFITILLVCSTLICAFVGGFSINDCMAVIETGSIKSSILIESSSGKILSEMNSKEKMPIASVTKLMTILLVLEKIDNGELHEEKVVVASENAAKMGGSQVFIEKGGEYKVLDLLKAVIISSANDACVALCEEISGSEKEFVNLMNQKAQQLGLECTNYANSTGLPAPMQYSSAFDVSVVMQEVLKHPLYLELSSIWMEDFVHPNERVTLMSNTNRLLKTYELCDGGKTGSTAEAGYCLCATAQNDNMRLISVVLGADSSKTRFNESKKLLEYGFKNFESKKLVDKNVNLATDITLEKAQENDLQVFAERDFVVITKRGEQSGVVAELNIPQTLTAPLKVGDIIGTIRVLDNGIVVDEINVIVNNEIDSVSYFKAIQNITKRWLI